MEEDIKISIIIPLFNVEDYIEDCYNSIYRAIEDYRNIIEIIVVDDCGNDNSLKIINKIKKGKTYVISHKVNLGLGGARNTGFNYSKGEWLMFIDSDDRIKDNTIEMLLNFIKKNPELNVIKYGYIEEYENKKIEYTYKKNDFYIHSPVMSWAKIIKKKIFIKFKNYLKHEDLYWKYEFIIHNEIPIKVGKINTPLYIYNRKNENSITNSIHREDEEKIIKDSVSSYLQLEKGDRKNELYNMIFLNFLYYLLIVRDVTMVRVATKSFIKIKPFSIVQITSAIRHIKQTRLKVKVIEMNNEK